MSSFIIKSLRELSSKIGGVSGYLPAVYTSRTAESDAWTLHRAVSLGNSYSADQKSESDSNTDLDMAESGSGQDSNQLAHEKSEESYKEWGKYWAAVMDNKPQNVLEANNSADDKKSNAKPGDNETSTKSEQLDIPQENNGTDRRWIFTMRHGERVDLTYGKWVPHCYDENGTYVRKDLNMPVSLIDRVGGAEAYGRDTPLTRVGQLQATLVGEGLRLAGIKLKHVYTSPALRCVETAHWMLQGLEADPSVKIKIEPNLFESKSWYKTIGTPPFMSIDELINYGLNVDPDYKPCQEFGTQTSETFDECYKRNEVAMTTAVNDKKNDGNIMFVGHAMSLEIMALALKRLNDETPKEYPPYQIITPLDRVPYCALGAMWDKPYEVVSPPCPPSINTSSGRFNWRVLLDL